MRHVHKDHAVGFFKRNYLVHYHLAFPNATFFFFNDTATTEIYTLSLTRRSSDLGPARADRRRSVRRVPRLEPAGGGGGQDRKSTRLNSSHGYISYAVFCLKKKQRKYLSMKYKHLGIRQKVPKK